MNHEPTSAPVPLCPELQVRHLGEGMPYESTFAAMRSFTEMRDPTTADELWLLEHEPVLTQGQAGRPEHVLADNTLPVVQTDRGGQVTWHGPEQIVGYWLVDLPRRGWSVRDLVSHTEWALIEVLALWKIEAFSRADAPGVYVSAADGATAKIASLGYKIRRGRSYHGFALNVTCDLAGFAMINPCGMTGQAVTNLDRCVAWFSGSERANKQRVYDQLVSAFRRHHALN